MKSIVRYTTYIETACLMSGFQPDNSTLEAHGIIKQSTITKCYHVYYELDAKTLAPLLKPLQKPKVILVHELILNKLKGLLCRK